MDRWAGPAQLGYWVNRVTCIGPVEIDLSVTADDSGWHAAGSYAASVSSDERTICRFLAKVARYTTVTFPQEDGAQIDVDVEEADNGRLFLTVLPAPSPVGADRPGGGHGPF